MRTAAFSNQTLWVHTDWKNNTRDTCAKYEETRDDADRSSPVEKGQSTPNAQKGGNHGIKSPLRVAAITNQCVNYSSTFADRPTAQNRVVNSLARGTCKTDRSHMARSLEEVTQTVSCNLYTQEFGDLQTYYAHARLTIPAPTIRASLHAQPRGAASFATASTR